MMTKRRGIGHIIAALAIIIILILVFLAVSEYLSQRQEGNSYISGVFQGFTTVNKGSGDEYIVRISNATITCDSTSMDSSDIYALTHLQPGQEVTMSLSCSNIVVG